MEYSEAQLFKKVAQIRDKLMQLKNRDKSHKLFGASMHKYDLNPVLSEEEIANFENEFGIRLPEEYRFFLMHIGNGGAGPYYGIEKMSDSLYQDLDYKNENEKVNPSEPFPYTSAWNLDFEKLSQDRDCDDEYFAAEHSNGLLRLCNFGCGVFINLVVNGAEYGNMWMDDRCNDQGIYPYVDFDNSKDIGRINFLDWYELWLDKSLTEVEKTKL